MSFFKNTNHQMYNFWFWKSFGQLWSHDYMSKIIRIFYLFIGRDCLYKWHSGIYFHVSKPRRKHYWLQLYKNLH